MEQLPEIVQNHVAYANPYKITHAHGVLIEQTGNYKTSNSSKWKSIKSLQNFEYPKIEFEQQLNGVFQSLKLGIQNNSAFLNGRKWGIRTVNLVNSEEVLQSNVISYLSSLVWMPWAFASKHVLIKSTGSNSVSIALADYPNIWGEYIFSEEARILSFNAERYRFQNGHFTLTPWRVEYSKYNIKKSFKLPTQVKCFWMENNEDFLYLDLKKVLGYTVK